MSSSLARARSLRKPTQGSTTDLTSSTSKPTTSSTAVPQRNVSPSRLPAPRPTRPTTRAVSSGSLNDAAGAAAAAKKKPSPLSNLLSRGSSTRQTARKDASTSSTTSNGPPSAPLARSTASSLSRTSSTRDPAAGLNRLRNPAASSTSNLANTSTSTSSSRPTTSSGLAQKRTTPGGGAASSDPVRGHTRARSVATLNGSTTLRPPSQSSSTTSAAPRPRPTSMYGAPTTSSTTAAAPSHLSSKPSISSLSSRTRASSTASKTQPPARPPARQQTTPTSPSRPKAAPPPPKPVATTRQQQQASPTSPPRNKPLLKPAFTTLQQHYSPAKNLAPKPLTATYLAPPSPSKLPTNVALSAETSRLQTELLQLHLLHRELPAVTSQWHASARQKLSARHAELNRSSKELSALEADAAERINVAALHRWASSSSPDRKARGVLEDKIQRLDALLTALWSLDSPGGKHHRLVRAFERWASSLSELEAARARADDDADPSGLLDANLEVRFGGGLDARWKDECAALVRRLEGWEAQLRDLAYHEEQEAEGHDEGEVQVSSLKRMLDGCGSLVKDMLGELAVMEEIEAAAVARETEWIRKMNRRGDDGNRDTPRAGAVWRTI